MPVFEMGQGTSPVEICSGAVEKARHDGRDVILIDTAGRLHIDEELMQELAAMKDQVKPHEILLVVDAMTGQDAVTLAERFNEAIGIDGIVMTKLDGDARGGAALSVRFVTGKPIKFVGVGEKLSALEAFFPDRMVGRILGMGDVFTIIEKAEAAVDYEKAEELEKKLRTASFDMEDFLDQLQQIRKMGPLQDLLAMIPGFSQMKDLKNLAPDEKQISRIEAIIRSMTREERRNPAILNASRRRRIAAGSGTEVYDVNQLMKQYEMLKKMMKQFAGPGGVLRGGKMPKIRLPF
jgi:signal recognition particle subunit SRP54